MKKCFVLEFTNAISIKNVEPVQDEVFQQLPLSRTQSFESARFSMADTNMPSVTNPGECSSKFNSILEKANLKEC